MRNSVVSFACLSHFVFHAESARVSHFVARRRLIVPSRNGGVSKYLATWRHTCFDKFLYVRALVKNAAVNKSIWREQVKMFACVSPVAKRLKRDSQHCCNLACGDVIAHLLRVHNSTFQISVFAPRCTSWSCPVSIYADHSLGRCQQKNRRAVLTFCQLWSSR